MSEPLAFASCASLANAILAKYAPTVLCVYTGPALQHEFVGRNFRDLIAALEERHKFSIPLEDVEEWVRRELENTIALIKEKVVPCDGVMSVLSSLKERGKYHMAVVSSSALPRVQAALEATGQSAFFPQNKVFSAASMSPPTSKPDPAVYLLACRELGVHPAECVAIEDSRSGATAAQRAGIHLLGYVGPYYMDGEGGVDQAVTVLEEIGAEGIMHGWHEFEECLHRIEWKD